MKKLLAALALSTSVCLANVGHAHAAPDSKNLYAVEHISEEIDSPAQNAVFKWLFQGTAYSIFEKALLAVWDELEKVIKNWKHPEEESYSDEEYERIQEACDFYDEYQGSLVTNSKDEDDLLDLGEHLNATGLCQQH